MKNKFDWVLNEIESSNMDIKKRVLRNKNDSIAVLFISQLTDKKVLSQEIIHPLNNYLLQKKEPAIKAQEVADSVIWECDLESDTEKDRIINYVLKGMSVVLFSNDERYIIANTRMVQKRPIGEPELTRTMRAPEDSFNESLDDNLSLVRYRVKDRQLNIRELEVGRRSKTQVLVLYIADIANKRIVNDVTARIKKIDVDGILSSGELQNLLLNKKYHSFPRIGIIERSDMAAGALLEGKVIVMLDGSRMALVAPKLFIEFFASGDDFYDNTFLAVFMKNIRMLSAFLSVTITALFVAILNFHIDTLPVDFIVVISRSMQGVPFTLFVGALVLELIVEILREALIRVPKQIGPAIGIVGGIIIGQAAIAAKIFSPLLIIIVALSILSSFTAADYTIMNPLRIIKYFLIIASATFGLVGFVLAFSVVLINLVSANSFGVPYFAPVAPFNLNDLKNSFFYRKDISKVRPSYLNNKDNTRWRSKKD